MYIITEKDFYLFHDKAFSDFTVGAEQYRFVEDRSYGGTHSVKCYTAGGGRSESFTINFEGSGRFLAESHADYSASIQFNSTCYQQADCGALSAALNEARLIIEVYMSDNCSTLHAKDAARAAAIKLDRDLAKAEREARLASTFPVGLEGAEEAVAKCVKEMLSDGRWVSFNTQDRFTGHARKFSMELINGRVRCFSDCDVVSRKHLVERIAESDLDHFKVEAVGEAA